MYVCVEAVSDRNQHPTVKLFNPKVKLYYVFQLVVMVFRHCNFNVLIHSHGSHQRHSGL